MDCIEEASPCMQTRCLYCKPIRELQTWVESHDQEHFVSEPTPDGIWFKYRYTDWHQLKIEYKIGFRVVDMSAECIGIVLQLNNSCLVRIMDEFTFQKMSMKCPRALWRAFLTERHHQRLNSYPPIYIRPSSISGRGVFNLLGAKFGDLLTTGFGGGFVYVTDIKVTASDYMLEVNLKKDTSVFLDARFSNVVVDEGNSVEHRPHFTCFINHANTKKCNCIVLSDSSIWYCKSINQNEEITYDYGRQFDYSIFFDTDKPEWQGCHITLK